MLRRKHIIALMIFRTEFKILNLVLPDIEPAYLTDLIIRHLCASVWRSFFFFFRPLTVSWSLLTSHLHLPCLPFFLSWLLMHAFAKLIPIHPLSLTLNASILYVCLPIYLAIHPMLTDKIPPKFNHVRTIKWQFIVTSPTLSVFLGHTLSFTRKGSCLSSYYILRAKHGA